MAKKNQDEYVSVYYGIHMDTCEVLSAWVTRGGKISVGMGSHTVIGNRDIRSELMIVFSIADTICFPIGQHDSDWAKEQIASLKSKAEEIKKKKQAPLNH